MAEWELFLGGEKIIKDPKKPWQFVYAVQIKLQTRGFILFGLRVLLTARCVCVCVLAVSDVVLAVVFVLVWTKQSEAGMCIFVFKQRNMKPWKKQQTSVLLLLSFILTAFCFLLSEPTVSVSDFMFMRECVFASVSTHQQFYNVCHVPFILHVFYLTVMSRGQAS